MESISKHAELSSESFVPPPGLSLNKVRRKIRPIPRFNPNKRNNIQGRVNESDDESNGAQLETGPATLITSQQQIDLFNLIGTTMSSLDSPDEEESKARNDSKPEEILDDPPSTNPAAVPQIKLGPNGDIILDKYSLEAKVSLRGPSSEHGMLNAQYCYPNKSSTCESGVENHWNQLISGPTTPVPPRQRKESFTLTRTTPSPNRSRRPGKLQPEDIKRDALTMYNFIFSKPSSNRIITNEKLLIARDTNQKENFLVPGPELEDDPDNQLSSQPAPVPQIKLGPSGEIVLDEQSLVIKQRPNRKISSVVVEGSWTGLGSARYKRGPRTAEWKDEETVRFYRALAALGTDFMLMERLFPGRTRRDLKLKFKKEERENGFQVDKALQALHEWDIDTLEEEFRIEREESQQRVQEDAERLRQRVRDERERQRNLKEMRVRNSKASKAMEASILPDADQGTMGLTADDFIRRHLENEAKYEPRKRKTRASKKKSQLVPKATNSSNQRTPIGGNVASIQKIPTAPARTPELLHSASGVPSNIESGSLVVLTVDDPKSPSKKMLQTYIAQSSKLTPVALPPNLLNSVVSYMKKGAPRSTVSDASSPGSVVSHDSLSTTPGSIVQSPIKHLQSINHRLVYSSPLQLGIGHQFASITNGPTPSVFSSILN